MRKILLLIIFISQLTFSQEKQKKRFRMVVMAPKTIEVLTELKQYKDSIVELEDSE